jgi:hypothetical protein
VGRREVIDLKTRINRDADHPPKDEFDHLDIRGGGRPPDDMKPGEYVVECTAYTAKKDKRGGITAVILSYVTVDSVWRDVELRQWLPIYPGKPINPGTKTWNHWSIALGRKPHRREKFHPRVFVGKRFVSEVGYSSKEDGGKTFSRENTQKKKYGNDRLRVHSLKERLP